MSEKKEYIERGAAIAEIQSIPSGTIHTDYATFIIDRIPAADVEPVVRCKDCVKRKTSKCMMYPNPDSYPHYQYADDLGYCCYGKREN